MSFVLGGRVQSEPWGRKFLRIVRRRVSFAFADTVWTCGVLFLVNSISGNNDGRRRLS